MPSLKEYFKEDFNHLLRDMTEWELKSQDTNESFKIGISVANYFKGNAKHMLIFIPENCNYIGCAYCLGTCTK